MKRIQASTLLICLLALGLLCLVAMDETWLMPGPVSKFHAEFETECSKCHTGFSNVQNQSCLNCKLQMKFTDDRGIHKYAPIKQCGKCHVEHRTREYPLTSAWLEPKGFNHDWTGYALGRFHEKSDCAKCHVQGRVYRDVKTSCEGCHRDFARPLWDHSKKMGCTLDSLHDGLSCGRCHDQGWGGDSTPQCGSCHLHENYQPKDACNRIGDIN